MTYRLPMHRLVLAVSLAIVVLGTAPAALNGRPVNSSGSVTRLAGADRYATAAAVSRSSQPVGVPVAYIATGAGFPDALGAGPAAARQGGPLLLTASGSLPKATTDELRRLKPGRIVVVGGTAVVAPAVVSALAAYTSGSVTRLTFGLGPTVDSAKDARLTREAPVRMMSVWYNGPHDIGWLTDSHHQSMYDAQYAAGRSLHLIVYSGGGEGSLSTSHGTACGRPYPLSDRFVTDVRQVAGALAGSGTLYVTLFSEFQTYACRDNAWNPTVETNRYWRALQERYLAARTAIRAEAPNARVSLGWGGWQMRFDEPAIGGGRSMFQYFTGVMDASDFQSFQAMQSDTNVADVRAMTQRLGQYGPVMLAHYKPNSGSQATFDTDTRAMLTETFLAEMRGYGLFAWSFMDQHNVSASETTYQFVKQAIQRHGH